jgi:hypothetical protein
MGYDEAVRAPVDAPPKFATVSRCWASQTVIIDHKPQKRKDTTMDDKHRRLTDLSIST